MKYLRLRRGATLTLRQRNFDNTLTSGPGKDGGEATLAGRIRRDVGHMMAESGPALASHLSAKAVPVDKGPVDLDAEAGSVAEVQVTVAQFRGLAEEAIPQRVGLRPAV